MKLIGIEARNFLCYNKLVFTFTDGIWLITGENGSGKSSIFDAVTFALYGKTRGDIDSVIRTGSKCCIVKLVFEVDGCIQYKIVRKRSIQSGSELSIINLNNPLNTVTRPTIVETQAHIEDIIGLNYDLFISSAYFGQEKITNFMHKSPKERKELFSDMLGLGVYRIAEAQAKDKINELTLEINNKEIDNNHYNESVLSFSKEIEGSVYTQKDRDELEMRIHVLNDRIRSISDLSKHKQEAFDKYNFACSLTNDRNDNEMLITELEQNLKETRKEILSIGHKLKKFQKRALLKEIAALESSGKVCSKCGSVVHTNTNKDKIEQMKDMVRKIEKYETKLQGLTYNEASYQKDISLKYTTNDKYIKQLKEYSIDFNKDNKVSLLNEVHKANKELDVVVEMKQEVENKLLKMMQAKALIDDKHARINEYRKRIIIIKKYLTKIRSIMEEYKLLAHAFSRNGIPSYILENTLPELERMTNNILRTIMKEPFYIKFIIQKKTKSDKIKDTFDLSIFVDNVERQFNSCSGGEKVRISIAIRLAISKLLSQSTGITIKFLLIDELEYLDSEGLEKFVDIINSLKSQFDTILVISHLVKLRDMMDNFIVIEKGIDGTIIRKCI